MKNKIIIIFINTKNNYYNMRNKNKNKKWKIIGGILFVFLLFYFIGITKNTMSVVGEKTSLTYNDLTDAQKTFLSPILLDFGNLHREVKIEGTYDMSTGLSSFSTTQDKSGIICSNSAHFGWNYGNPPECQPPVMNDITSRTGGDYVLKFKYYRGKKDCDSVPVRYKNCQVWSMCGGNMWGSQADGSSKSVITWSEYLTEGSVTPYKVKNCHYETYKDGIYTIYDIVPQDKVFCKAEQTIVQGKYIYTCSKGGDIINVIPIKLKVTIPSNLKYGETFNIGVTLPEAVKTTSNVVTVKLVDSEGKELIYTGTTPSITITKPKVEGSVDMLVTVEYGDNKVQDNEKVYFELKPTLWSTIKKIWTNFLNWTIKLFK